MHPFVRFDFSARLCSPFKFVSVHKIATRSRTVFFVVETTVWVATNIRTTTCFATDIHITYHVAAAIRTTTCFDIIFVAACFANDVHTIVRFATDIYTIVRCVIDMHMMYTRQGSRTSAAPKYKCTDSM